VRDTRFEDHATLPVSTACVVANGMRETLASLLTAPVRVWCTEPVVPAPRAWSSIANGAHGYRVRGSHSEAAIVASAEDIASLVGAVLGEPVTGRGLSVLEQSVADRLLRALASTLAPLVGSNGQCATLDGAQGLSTYFDVVFDGGARGRVGVAAAAEPEPVARPGVSLDDILDADCELCVRLDLGPLSAAQILSLEPGMWLPISTSKGFSGVASVAGTRLCDGECGVMNGRYALAVIDPTRGRSNSPSL